MPNYIILLGCPSAGKGTQAGILRDIFGLPHIASGDLFRDNIKHETRLGRLAKQYIDKGELVPDDVTIEMVRERLSQPDAKPGAFLDGFPRTVPQAEALNKLLAEFGGRVNSVVYIQVHESVLLQRLSGRWVCRGPEAHTYHMLFNPPHVAGKCDEDGAELYQREDDKPEVQVKRIQVFLQKTAPLIEYYRARKLLVEIDGEPPIPAVTEALRSAIEATLE